MNDIKESVDKSGFQHKKTIMASYGTTSFVNELIQGVLIFMLFFFYEVEVGLSGWWTGLGLLIYALWDAFNDPLLGFLSDRPYRFTKKFGRRFPWIVVGFIPMLISFVLIFSPPNVDATTQPLVIFGWLVFTLCLFDTCETFFTVNYVGLFPDKFRGREERVKAQAISVYIGIVGVVFANLLPMFIVDFGNVGSYVSMAWICVIISLIAFALMIPGVRDDKESVETYLANYEKQEKESFFKMLKEAFKSKSFIAFLLFYMLYLTLTAMVQASFVYWVSFIIFGTPNDVLYVMVLMLLGVMVGIPLWFLYNRKTGDNRKTMLYAGIAFAGITFSFSFLTDLTTLLIVVILWGMALGGFWSMHTPTFSDVIDEAIATTGRRREGLYSGFRRFFSNISKVIQALLFALVHDLTGFSGSVADQSPSADIGILLLFGIIPAILMGVGAVIFWRFYDITAEKSKANREHIKELNL